MMKKLFRSFFLVMAIIMVLSVFVVAANTKTDNDLATIKDPISGATVEFASTEDGEERINVTYTASKDVLSPSGYYLVLMVKGANASTALEDLENKILYIDQTTAQSAGNDQYSVSFQVYPSSLEDSMILITGVNSDGTPGAMVAAIIEAKFMLGDLTGDKKITTADLTGMAQYLAGTFESSTKVADLTGDGKVTTADLTHIAQYLAGTAQIG